MDDTNVVYVYQGISVTLIRGNTIPVKGHQVDLFCKPYPTVENVLLWPSDETLKQLSIDTWVDGRVTAIAFLK